jgi:filamentous hemagglutinin
MGPASSTVGTEGESSLLGASPAGAEAAGKANLGNKLEYFFGRATRKQHNIDQSVDLLRQLQRIGLPDSPNSRRYLTDHLNQVIQDPSNISSIEADGRIVRESLLMGPQGGSMLLTIWKNNSLITARIIGGGW